MSEAGANPTLVPSSTLRWPSGQPLNPINLSRLERDEPVASTSRLDDLPEQATVLPKPEPIPTPLRPIAGWLDRFDFAHPVSRSYNIPTTQCQSCADILAWDAGSGRSFAAVPVGRSLRHPARSRTTRARLVPTPHYTIQPLESSTVCQRTRRRQPRSVHSCATPSNRVRHPLKLTRFRSTNQTHLNCSRGTVFSRLRRHFSTLAWRLPEPCRRRSRRPPCRLRRSAPGPSCCSASPPSPTATPPSGPQPPTKSRVVSKTLLCIACHCRRARRLTVRLLHCRSVRACPTAREPRPAADPSPHPLEIVPAFVQATPKDQPCQWAGAAAAVGRRP
jgi:hypothetical protein